MHAKRATASALTYMKILVSIHPNSKKPRIIKDAQGSLSVYVNQPAIDGRANEATIEALAKYFKLKKAAVQLISGIKFKKKIFEIEKTE